MNDPMPSLPSVARSGLGRWVEERLADHGRVRLGLVGPPGVGKSTVADELSERFSAPVVPMDGFHLAHAVLAERGQTGVKGAPHTFDGWGFLRCLERIAAPPPGAGAGAGAGGERDEVVFVPRFDRSLEDPIAGAIAVRPDAPLVLVEGNYLLLDQSPWDRIAATLTHVAYLHLDDDTRRRRLIDRHVRFGKSMADAAAFVERSDEANARLVAATAARADLVIDLD